MRIVLLQPYLLLDKGEEMEAPQPVASLLIRRGIAKPVAVNRPAHAPSRKPAEPVVSSQ